jgi:glycosyltransferase involved in cell wall biosynthesis
MIHMLSLLRRIKKKFFKQKNVKQKTYESWALKSYCPNPEISFIIQSHNKSKNVLVLVEKLRKWTNSEIIVIDDGSELKHTLLMVNFLTKANEFIVRCNDLYEVITYDRAINLAKGQYVVLLQDDDDFDELSWIEEGLRYFYKDPLLAIVGGRDAARLLPIHHDGRAERGPFIVENSVAYRANSFKIEICGSVASSGFSYVPYVDRAPMWIKRDLFLNLLKEIDISFAPFQWDDAELCLRAWVQGLHVGHYSAKFKLGGLGEGGMRIWNNELHHRQDELNVKRLYLLYEDKLPYIDTLVQQCSEAQNNLTNRKDREF